MRFKPNDRIVLNTDFDTSIGITVPAKKSGIIIDKDPENGNLEVRLDEPVPGLEHWHNQITVSTVDYDKISRTTPNFLQRSATRQVPSYAAIVACVVVFTIGYMTPTPIVFADPKEQALLTTLVKQVQNEERAEHVALLSLTKEVQYLAAAERAQHHASASVYVPVARRGLGTAPPW